MQIDLELYRREARVSIQPPLRLSVIDIAPDFAAHTLVFVHGFGGQATQWQYQLEEFSKNNRTIAIDLRGHGRSDRPRDGYSMPEMLEDLNAVLDRLGVTAPFTLIGHSFGGAIAAEYAAANPRRVERLALVATAGEYRLNTLFRRLLSLPAATLQALAPLTRRRLGAPPHLLKAFYEQNLCCWTGWELYRRLNVPTLVIRGHYDRVFARPAFEQVARAIPDAEEVDVGASGHMVMLERRDAVNRAINRFLEAKVKKSSVETSNVDSRELNGDTPGGWRSAAERNRRPTWTDERPWLPYYDDNVPHSVAVPRSPAYALLESARRRWPRRTALNFEGRKLTYTQLEADANRCAALLRSLGVVAGERVMIILPNCPQFVIAYFGALKAGAAAVFSLPSNPPEELTRQIRDCGASVLITLTQFDSLIHQIKTVLEPAGGSPLRHVIFAHIGDYLPLWKRLALQLSPSERMRHLLDVSFDDPGGRSFQTHIFRHALRRHSPDVSEVERAPHDLAIIQYTGGTTDRPKGVMLSHHNLMANAIQTRHWIPAAREGEERFLCVVPFAHSYGLTAALNTPIALAATLIVQPRFDPAGALKTIRRLRPTIFPGVPGMFAALKDFPGVRKYGIESIRACISGSAPLPVEVQEAFEKLTRGRLVEGYGLTEAGPVTHANPLGGLRKVGHIGVPLPSTEARVVDLRRRRSPVKVGQIGELAVRGPQVMLGYWNDPQATSQALSDDGWLLTGDVAQMDADGYFRIIARKADMWYPTKPGEPAFPRDIEETLFEAPQVKEAAVVAIAGQPIAFVIPRDREERPSAETLIAYCKRRLPPELVPRLVIFVDDFPRSFIGKVLRRELAERFKQSSEFEVRSAEFKS